MFSLSRFTRRWHKSNGKFSLPSEDKSFVNKIGGVVHKNNLQGFNWKEGETNGRVL